MTDRPILFSAPMIRALLDGRKTQTRRLIKFAGVGNVLDFVKVGTDPQGRPVYEMKDGAGKGYARPSAPGLIDYHFKTPIGFGDRLWARETWQGLTFGDYLPTKSSHCEVRYAATDPCADLDASARGYPWRPSIFMPRWASRLTLIVTDVRVERLQAITEADAVVEGCFKGKASGRVFANEASMHLGGDEWASARDWYADLWDEINGPGAWDLNPWVAAYTFTVHQTNIDQIGRAAA